jgi:hypothetical protein
MKTNFILPILFLFFPVIIFAQQKEKEEITQMLDKWHLAAANADETNYFNGIDDDGIYIGTDATEIWTKREFLEWSKPYFDEGKAWNFIAIKRNIYLAEDLSFAWFDELLQFPGGAFRGSGVLSKKDGQWKLKQYVLSLPVPNEKFKEVMAVINPKEPEKEVKEK